MAALAAAAQARWFATRRALLYSACMHGLPEDDEAATDLGALSELLLAAERGGAAREQTNALFAALYRELHRLARRELHRGAAGATLSATTLLHETYLDLRSRGLSFPDRPRFFAYAARAMRGLIVDHVRRGRAVKRGGQFELTSFDETGAPAVAALQAIEPLSDALDALARADAALAELVELKYFCSFDLVEIASMRGVTERTAQRHWDKARLFLKQSLGEG
jgi:RNA polymerase sigma factor (TIGR02999 family)